MTGAWPRSPFARFHASVLVRATDRHRTGKKLATLVIAVITMTWSAQGQVVPELQLREELRLGDGSNTFANVIAIVPAPADAFFVADAGEKMIRLFDRSGRLLRTIGREGSGPGEFRTITAAGRRADTLWVVDSQLRRISLFSSGGQFLRSIDAPVLGGALPAVRAILPEAFLLQTTTFVGAAGTNHGHDNVVALLDRRSTSVDTVSTLAFGVGDWLYRHVGATPYSVIVPNPFNDGSLFDSDSRGHTLVVVNRQVTRRTRFEVASLDSAGRRRWSRQFSYSPQPIESAVKDSVVRNREIGAIAIFPQHMPAVSRVVAGEDGTIWVRREELGNNGRSEWNVMASDGRMAGRFNAPKRMQIHVATADHILAVTEDENDAQLVVRYVVVGPR
jgi:hypothetical protein